MTFKYMQVDIKYIQPQVFLLELRSKIYESDNVIMEMLVRSLSSITEV
jgi:hypothetical protein